MPWFEIAVIIDAMIEDGDYPAPREQEADSFAERIGDYNIPDEIDEMTGDADTKEPVTAIDEDYNLTDEELYACVDGFLALTYNLQDGWQEEMAAEVAKAQPDEYVIYDLFRDIEEKLLTVSNSYVECFAFEDHVTIRVDNVDLDFAYQEIAERIKALIEIGDFPVTVVQQNHEQKAKEHEEAEQREQEQDLKGTLFPFQRAKGQPDFEQEAPPPAFDDAQFIEITDIPRFDEIDTFVPVPKVVEFPKNAGRQISLFDLIPNDTDSDETPDASFVLDEDTVDEAGDGTKAAEPVIEPTAPETRKSAPAPKRPKRINYHYSADDNLYPPGAKTKFQNNMEAIRLLQRIESERRLATADEQKILAQYVGWGGIADAFNPKADSWDKEYRELKLALDEKDYAKARDSILTAYYTEPELVSCLYGALEQFGFTDGKNRRILDPAMGTGNFYSVLPEQLQNAKLTGVEIDSITGRLARQLYQKADVQITGFETSDRKSVV
jgi:hypothetical protein